MTLLDSGARLAAAAVTRTTLPPSAAALLDYWFGPPGSPEYGTWKSFWFSSTPAIDEEVRSLFGEDYRKAASGELAAWAEAPYPALALTILLDQVPRHLFRGDPQTYATDHLALKLCQEVLAKGFDKKLELPVEKHFLAIPMLHSEDMEMQTAYLERARAGGNPNAIHFAERYYNIISKFGRFPARNVILNRTSTPEEIEFLKQKA